jgi:hypothetical protein
MQNFYFMNKKLLLYIMQYIPQIFLVKNISVFLLMRFISFAKKIRYLKTDANW